MALRLFLLFGATFVAAFGSLSLVLAILLACWLGSDIVLTNTALIFKRDPRPLSIMRSMVFTMVSYASLALAFAPFWIWTHEFRGLPWRRSLDAVWQSVRTLTTAGPEVSLCPGGKILATIETFFGVYFLAVIFAGYVSWLGKGETR